MVNYDIKNIYQWPQKPKLVAITSISLLIFILGLVIDIFPYKSQIAHSIKQEEDLKQQLQLMYDRQVTLKHDITHLPEMQATLLDWQQRIVMKPEVPSLLTNILKAGEANHLKITTFNPGNEIKEGIYYKTSINIDLGGTYDQIANFISQLANMPSLVNIKGFTISRNKTAGAIADYTRALNSDTALNAKMEIEIYRR